MKRLIIPIKISLSVLAALAASISAASTFTPGAPCNGCTIDISDHAGIAQTSKNAVYRVNNPVTPNGTPPFLELYNPTLATIQNCASMVSSVQGPTPFTVQLKAREYTLSGSNQVVFLVEKCRKVNMRPDARPGMQKLPKNAGKPGMGQRPEMGQRPGMGPRPGMDGRPKLGGGMGPGSGNNCGSGTPPASTSCSTSGGGWQSVSNVLSEDNCQLGYTDAAAGPGQFVLYDNDYSVTCTGGTHKPAVFVSNARSNSNWGAYVQPSETCQMKTGPSPTGSGRVVEKIVCP
jgi:hypothetical protein